MASAMRCPYCYQQIAGSDTSTGECPHCHRDLDYVPATRGRRSGPKSGRKKRGQTGKPTKRNKIRKTAQPQMKPSRKPPGEAIHVYTDGSCRHTGEGGWAFAYKDKKGDLVTGSGSEAQTTNNRMELESILYAMRHFSVPAHLAITSDSQYAIKGLQTWMYRWRECGWMRGQRELKNADLWKQLYAEVQRHVHVSFMWVRGHNGHVMNELCDRLACEASGSRQKDEAEK